MMTMKQNPLLLPDPKTKMTMTTTMELTPSTSSAIGD
jgi:hypothetical protein